MYMVNFWNQPSPVGFFLSTSGLEARALGIGKLATKQKILEIFHLNQSYI